MKLPVAITLSEQENDLLSREPISFEACLGTVEEFDCVAFLKPSLERLQHYSIQLPVLISTNAARHFSLLDANVNDDSNCFVITP